MYSNYKNVVVLIPVYKRFDNLFKDDLDSILNTVKVFFNYNIYIIGNSDILDEYLLHIKGLKGKSYFKKYFKSISSYNKLLLTKDFYQLFGEYKNIVIIHTDSWVFYDNLNNFLDFHYIGPPWENSPIILKDYNINSEGKVGNGGFSSRDIKFCTDVLTSSKKIFLLSELLDLVSQLFKNVFYKRNIALKLFFLIKLIGLYIFFNKFKFIAKWYQYINEDVVFGVLSNKVGNYNYPSVNTAALFGIEKYIPSGINKNQIMGCHSYNRRSKEFWFDRIKHE